ncbi:MAG: alpha/beta hydrolase [Ruminococcaceae bacterium]|nr:alpha/beta hydrolase [Oscillospiraceae bacterium]
MKEKTYKTDSGGIRYWISIIDADMVTLVLLPGLTADHRLFEKQIEYFEGKYNLFVWDAPAHAASRPFEFNFGLMDKAKWLKEILERENIKSPVIAGQSMGGFVGQAFSELYPEVLKGFIVIDSTMMQKKYVKRWELWLLKRQEFFFSCYPWKLLLKLIPKAVAETEYGRNLMYEMMMEYDEDKRGFCKLAGHGFKIFAEALEEDLPYAINCPALLICGEKDRAGYVVKFNEMWHKETGIPIEWIENAGHNSNTDKPEIVNGLIDNFIKNNV